MTKILLACAWIAFLFWRVKRAKEHAAERAASGGLREPLYWVGNTLSLTTLGFSIYILASPRPAHIDGGLWFTVIALFIATVVVWLMLKRRHGI